MGSHGTPAMVSPAIIPIVIVGIAAAATYLAYLLRLKDYLARRSVDRTLLEYGINKTQHEIVSEYHASRGEEITGPEVDRMVRHYRQNQPDKFLAMYDEMRDRSKQDGA